MNVQKNPYRQSWRNRLPGHSHRSPHGDRHRRRLLGRRCARALRANGRRSGAYRAGPCRRELPAARQDHRRVQADRGRRPCIRAMASCPNAPASSRRWTREDIAFIGPPANAIAAMGDKIESKKLAKVAGVNTVPGSPEAIDGTDEALKWANRYRLPGDDESQRGRRRQGNAARLERHRCARRLRGDTARRAQLVRRRARIHREVHRGPAPYRDPGARRQARHHPLSQRTRMLDPSAATRRWSRKRRRLSSRPRCVARWANRRWRWPVRSITTPPGRSS